MTPWRPDPEENTGYQTVIDKPTTEAIKRHRVAFTGNYTAQCPGCGLDVTWRNTQTLGGGATSEPDCTCPIPTDPSTPALD